MNTDKDSKEIYKEYVENLLYNHDIVLVSQFIKDLSFDKKEDFLFFEEDDFKGKSNFNLNIDVEHQEHNEDMLLVTLRVNLVGSLGGKNIFNLELDYCGVFQIPLVTQELMEKQVKVECPKILFPYVRRIISQIMVESGLPNVDIKNINFFEMYKENT
ncbi:hypothetical protein CBE37_00155 [bacterium TMED277]|nr:MAG: hypothetical protein CBE37_00155 [bacterium TMED277]